MARKYTLNRRAEQQAETRRRIVEAAVDLHSSVGPAQTTISMIADRAKVQRHTFYAHFPEERDLFMACSGMALERDPLPDAEAWRQIGDPAERIRAGLAQVYGWYERNAGMTACVLRDAEFHQITRETAELRFGPAIGAWHEVLGAGLSAQQRAMLHLALSFHSWRALVQESGLPPSAARDLMVGAVGAAGRGDPSASCKVKRAS